MQIHSTQLIDTFAEAFKMWGSRVIITGETSGWALAAARSMTGFATSVIGCKCEAGIERELSPAQTPDRRPGVSVLLFAMDKESLGKRLVERIGQCVMTCPTTACYNGLDTETTVVVGGQLRYFGDGFQASKKLAGRRLWRIPVMDGEFLVDERFGVQPAVGGGNLLVVGEDIHATLAAAQAAVGAMRGVEGVILPFPDGIVRSGSKVGSKYKSLMASTNVGYCPSLRGIAEATSLEDNAHCVLEIVIDGLDLAAVEEAMLRGIQAAAGAGIKQISAGNYGGNLGQFKIELHRLRLYAINLFKNADNVEEYSAGETIFEEGQAGDVMYVVLEGEVEIRAHGQPVNKLGPGDLVGEMGLIDSKARSASAVVLSRCRLTPVDEKRFLSMVVQSPFFALYVMRELVYKLRSMTETV